MTEAQLRVVASELFREMGMDDSPDTLDFFQKNAENGDSSEWKKCLKSPSTRVTRRTSSDGTALVHLKKKYSTGLVSDQDQPTRSIKASDIEVSPSIRSRKFSPSVKQKNRFGYSSTTAKVADATTISKGSSETKPVASGYSTEETKSKGMFKGKRSQAKSSAPVVGSHSIKGTSSSKLPTSLSGGRSPTTVRPFGKSASNGSIPIRTGSNLPLSSKQQITSPSSSAMAKYDQNDATLGNGPQSSIPRPGAQPSHSRTGSHGSAALLAADSAAQMHKETETSSKKMRSISLAHSSIDTTKLSSINMRSLTRSRIVDDRKPPERKTSDTGAAERKISDSRSPERKPSDSRGMDRKVSDSGAVERKVSDSRSPERKASDSKEVSNSGATERKISDTNNEKKRSFIPPPHQHNPAVSSKTNASSSATAGSSATAVSSAETGSGIPRSSSTTQVLYSRKPSFKLIPMSTSSRRILHTVQDGGMPKRHNAVSTKSPQPPTSTAGPAMQHSHSNPKPAEARVVKETVVLRHAKETPKPEKVEIKENPTGYDSLPVREKNPDSDKDDGQSAQQVRQGQNSSAYDRLSPPIQNPLNASKHEEPFYDTIDEHRKDHDHANKERKISNGSKSESHPNRHLKLRPPIAADVRGIPHTETAPASLASVASTNYEQSGKEALPTMPVDNHGNDHVPPPSVNSKSPVTEDDGKPTQGRKTSGQAARKLSDRAGDFGFQRKLDKKIPHSIPRYTSKSGDTYSLVSKPRVVDSKPAQKRTSMAGAVEEITSPSAEVPKVIQLPRSVTTPSLHKNVDDEAALSGRDQHHHRPLNASLSDSSTMRTTPISFKVQAVSNESVEIGSLPSTASGASSEQELQERGGSSRGGRPIAGGLVPRGGEIMMASTERKAKLEVNWSDQSLDRNMQGMVSTTVVALSNLVEVISSPPTSKSDDGSGDDSIKMPWYRAVDGDDSSGGLCVSMSPVSSATTPSTSATSPAHFKGVRGDTISPRDITNSGNFEERNSSSPEKANTTNPEEKNDSSNALSPAEQPHEMAAGKWEEEEVEENRPSVPTRTFSLPGDMVPRGERVPRKSVPAQFSQLETETKTVGEASHTDGAAMSRIPPRRNTVGSRPLKTLAPPIPPKSKPVKPPAPPPPSHPQNEQKSGIPVTRRLGYPPPPLRLHQNKQSKAGSDNSASKLETSPHARSSSDQRPRKDKPKMEAWPATVGRAGALKKAKDPPPNPLNHDYAVLEDPSDHDYAILDPEYHDEFYGYCHSCTEPIIGIEKGCVALEQTYHIKCFTCSTCGVSLLERNFYLSQGHLLCEKDLKITYEQCRNCKRSIRERVIKALGYSYHPECFKCTVCGRCLDGVHYTCDQKKKLYCIQDYHKVYASKCAVCDQSIIPCNGQKKSLQVLAMNKNYHIQCYKCEQCEKQLASWTGGGEKCYPLNGHLLCKTCHSSRARELNIRFKTPPPLASEMLI